MNQKDNIPVEVGHQRNEQEDNMPVEEGQQANQRDDGEDNSPEDEGQEYAREDNLPVEEGRQVHQEGDGYYQNDLEIYYQLTIYRLSNYSFGTKPAVPFRPESLADRISRMKLNYETHGLRTFVQAVMLVDLFQYPHLLLLQERNSTLKLPGGRIRRDESDLECLRRKLESKLSLSATGDKGAVFQEFDLLGMWWKIDFESELYPCLPPNVKKPKECIKLYLIKLPRYLQFVVQKNLKPVAVPLCQLRDNKEKYGSIISEIPQMLSKYTFKLDNYF